MSSRMIDWALYYASIGWAVFPLVPGTKSPFKDSNGSTEATTDRAKITAWWTEHPDANIGTRPSAAGKYVYDVDPRNGGDNDHVLLQQQHGAIESNLRVDSPSGGWHYYFEAPAGQRYDGKPAAGIDGKYNGYAVLPPSRHPNGGLYRWANGAPKRGVAAPDIPGFLVRSTIANRGVAGRPAGTLEDLPKIQEALSLLTEEHHYEGDNWRAVGMALKDWAANIEGADDLAFELYNEWSAKDPDGNRYDPDKMERRWEYFNNNRDVKVTLGTVLHMAGITAAQKTQALAASLADAFRSAPGSDDTDAPPLPDGVETIASDAPTWWTTAPVPRFRGTLDPAEVLVDLYSAPNFKYVENKDRNRLTRVVGSVVWAVGGSCEHALAVLVLDGYDDTPDLRGLIAADAQQRMSWKSVNKLNAQQTRLFEAGEPVQLVVDDGAWAASLDQVLNLLPKLQPVVLQRAGCLCRVMEDGRIVDHTVHSIAHLLESNLEVIKGKAGAPTKTPEALARRLLDLGQYPNVDEVRAVMNLPVARADGTVLSAMGIDEATGLYLQGTPTRAPQVLTDDERDTVMTRIWSLFDGFPFATPADRSAYFAALLTTAVRSTLPTAPGFLINASTAGTGKTKLGECLMVAADASKGAYILPDETVEQNKTIMAILGNGPRGVLFDNLIGNLKSTGPLCMAATSAEYNGRLMGVGRTVSLQNRAMWVLTGNNVWITGDMTRRILNIALDSPENPESRRFGFDPVKVLERSATDVRLDLLDLIHTWTEAGKPYKRGLSGFASFEEWSELVRPVCLWLGMVDPLNVVRAVQAEDPKVEKLALVMAAWEARFGFEEVALRDIKANPFAGEDGLLWQDAEAAVCTYKQHVDPTRWGYYLREIKGIKMGGREFVGRKCGPTKLWKLSKL